MAVVVIGGQASGVGKTSVICGLIAAMPERRWTAIKLTRCGHQEGAGQQCGCELRGRAFAMTEEKDHTAGTDSSRYLAAGARRSFWVRTRPDSLADAMPSILTAIAEAQNVILESNSVLGFLKPDVYALIVSPSIMDFKPSARRYIDRADALLVAAQTFARAASPLPWDEQIQDRSSHVPRFSIAQPRLVSPELVAWITERLNTVSIEAGQKQKTRSEDRA